MLKTQKNISCGWLISCIFCCLLLLSQASWAVGEPSPPPPDGLIWPTQNASKQWQITINNRTYTQRDEYFRGPMDWGYTRFRGELLRTGTDIFFFLTGNREAIANRHGERQNQETTQQHPGGNAADDDYLAIIKQGFLHYRVTNEEIDRMHTAIVNTFGPAWVENELLRGRVPPDGHLTTAWQFLPETLRRNEQNVDLYNQAQRRMREAENIVRQFHQIGETVMTEYTTGLRVIMQQAWPETQENQVGMNNIEAAQPSPTPSTNTEETAEIMRQCELAQTGEDSGRSSGRTLPRSSYGPSDPNTPATCKGSFGSPSPRPPPPGPNGGGNSFSSPSLAAELGAITGAFCS